VIALAKNPLKNADTNRLILQLLRVHVLPGQKVMFLARALTVHFRLAAPGRPLWSWGLSPLLFPLVVGEEVRFFGKELIDFDKHSYVKGDIGVGVEPIFNEGLQALTPENLRQWGGQKVNLLARQNANA